jgi:homogentisate 1,2-dioxygenase
VFLPAPYYVAEEVVMHVPWIRGRVATQAHVGLPEGTVEEEYARDGFFGGYAHLYRKHPPVGWTRIEGPLRPRAYDTRRLEANAAARKGEWLEARTLLLHNADARLELGVLDSPMPWFYRNADADELLFVHDGSGRLESDFGPLPYETGDYLLMPRGTTYRLAPSRSSRFLVISTRQALGVPDRGILGQHALFDPAVVRVPTPEGSAISPNADGEFELRIVQSGEVTRVFYPHCPVDTVGWKGTLAPMQLNVRDIRPVASERYHLPPTAHATFVAGAACDVVICTFLPRPLEIGDRTALKVPFYHANVDYDEVLFYHAGEFFSRQGISPGMITFHPQGIHHGPQPGASERAASATRTEEVAVMIDTRLPLRTAGDASAIECADYWKSWKGERT